MEFSDIDYRDIQGLVRFAHGHLPEAQFYLAEIADVATARKWLRGKLKDVTTAHAGEKPRTAFHIALTCEGLRKFGVPDKALDQFALEFTSGMVDPNRSRRLGDVGDNAPSNWAWGAEGKPRPHILVMLYAEVGGLKAWEDQILDADWNAGFGPAYPLSTWHKDELEPFGFVDGVSQPTLDWDRSKPARATNTTKYTNLSALGEFLLGYPNEYGRYTDRPLLDAGAKNAGVLPLAEDMPGKRDFGRNGTFLVFRDLGQDVTGFHDFIKTRTHPPKRPRDLAGAMSGRVPADIPLIPDWPRQPKKMEKSAQASEPSSRIWQGGPPPWNAPYAVDDPEELIPPGTPITPLSAEAIEGVGPALKDIWLDYFTFKKDPDGATCPYGAHIRRANPRNADYPEGTRGIIGRFMRLLGFNRKHTHDDLLSSTRFHRVLRRGRDYVEDGGARTGLRFICLNANISRQFEFIQVSWLANSKFNALDEDDPLLGARTKLMTGASVDRFTRRDDNGIPCRLQGLPQFVTVHGGAYFFLPGIRALHYIAG